MLQELAQQDAQRQEPSLAQGSAMPGLLTNPIGAVPVQQDVALAKSLLEQAAAADEFYEIHPEPIPLPDKDRHEVRLEQPPGQDAAPSPAQGQDPAPAEASGQAELHGQGQLEQMA